MKLSFSIVYERIKRLFIPLVFWSGVGFLFNPKLFSFKNTMLQIFTGKVVDTPLYYLNVLILFTFVYWLITFLPQKIRTPLHFIIIISALSLDYSGISFRFFNPMIEQIKRSYGQIVELIKYASLGILFATLAKQNKKTLVLFCLTVISLLLSVFYKFPETYGFNYSGANLFIGTIFVLSLALLIGDLKLPEKINKFISMVGAYSFGVYLFHIIFLEKLAKVMPILKVFNNHYPLLFLILYTAACYVFCFLFDSFTKKKFSYLIK
jgi:peptidoglycan/LPS O-acetylase OafA/YrhL